MKIDISYKNIKPDEPLKVFVKDKIGGLEKLLKGIVSYAQVEIGKPSKHHRKGEIFRAEANIKINGETLRAQASHYDLRAAITDVKNKVQRELKKLKDKKVDSKRRVRK